MRERFVALVTLAVMVLGMSAALAAVNTTITARYNAETERFTGVVDANDAECVANRRVKVFKKTADGLELQGRTRANSEGRWRLDVMEASGQYVAVAPVYETMAGATCEKARSGVVDVM